MTVASNFRQQSTLLVVTRKVTGKLPEDIWELEILIRLVLVISMDQLHYFDQCFGHNTIMMPYNI